MRFLPAALVLLFGFPLATAGARALHDDDPKLLDTKLPYRGEGYRRNQSLLVPSLGGAGLPPSDGLAFNFPSFRVSLLSWLPLPEIGGTSTGNDCWGYVSPSGREYALVGTSDGTAFVDVTQPGAPVVVSIQSGPFSSWRDVKVYGAHAYSVSEGGGGIQVFDLTQIDLGIVSLVNTITSGGSTTATHNVAINEDSGFLYRCGGSFHGLRIYSLADPVNPTFVAEWNDRYCHDAQVVTYSSGPYAGKEIAFVCSGSGSLSLGTGVEILDVTDKSNIQMLAQMSYSTIGYSHQAWLSDDKQLMYLNDESDGPSVPSTTVVIDVSDLSNPFEVSAFTNGLDSVTHNNYIRGDEFFASNYTSGLRVFDLSVSTSNPPEVAFFDTYTESDAATFNSLWSNYPLLPSGVVIGSDKEKGLFVWWVGDPLLEFAFPQGIPATSDPGGGTLVQVQINPAAPGDLNAASAMLHYDDGSGLQQLPLTNLGGGAFEGALPAAPCGDVLRYFVSAESTNGVRWTAPAGAPLAFYTTTVSLDEELAFEDTGDSPLGWTVGDPADTATTGVWELGDPVATTAQPEFDHTELGTDCWFTGQQPVGGSLGSNVVDGGQTTLTSPAIDVANLTEPWIGYWRWFSNNHGGEPNADSMRVEVQSAGSAWELVEQVGPMGPESSGGWYRHQFRVADFVAVSSDVRVRFIAADEGVGSIVEAAIDDLCAFDLVCDGLVADLPSISVSGGGTQSLSLAAGASLAGESYWILGSISGMAPGLPLGAFTLPVNLDAYTLVTLTEPNAGALVDTLGTLDGTGKASAAITLPPASNPNWAGLSLHHAFFAFDFGAAEVLSVSNAVQLDLLP